MPTFVFCGDEDTVFPSLVDIHGHTVHVKRGDTVELAGDPHHPDLVLDEAVEASPPEDIPETPTVPDVAGRDVATTSTDPDAADAA